MRENTAATSFTFRGFMICVLKFLKWLQISERLSSQPFEKKLNMTEYIRPFPFLVRKEDEYRDK